MTKSDIKIALTNGRIAINQLLDIADKLDNNAINKDIVLSLGASIDELTVVCDIVENEINNYN